ncbi:uncharacterized protein LOC112510083 [Cynara cardunculus var. scolymus]|uniref:Uncharacterized protein n=1 Tax=Cynara cardunculus var. scolymus TaxID=59895 RepID=A0A124SGG7_CYNCS|nr:uncharacterized protein LOC112510083 [Cynara cardunculus var. scolymus]KVI06328.1 Protein of unknown function DUF1645 [Cynara cardunculus var. scolymus]
MQSNTLPGISPSFTAHSSTNLADVAARVVEEFRHENGDDYDDIFNFNGYDHDYDDGRFAVPADDKADTDTPSEKLKDENSDTDDDDDEFEFAVVSSHVNSSSISADEISQGHISPRYPLFDRSLLLDVDPNLIKVVNGSPETDCKPSLVVRLPLRKLFSEERDFSSWSSSEADDLDGVNPGTYCVWKPKTESPGRCKKSNSTGNSSRRWKFRDILYRSNSDSKESPFLLFKPLISTNKKINNEKVEKSAKVASAVGGTAENGGSRRRSYLPSGQALVGAFTNVSRSNRNLRPF